MRLIDADVLKYNGTDYMPTGEWVRKEDIDAAPTIEPKKGKWYTQDTEGRFGMQVVCSECGTVFWEWMSKFRFCPNCGAKMERSEE